MISIDQITTIADLCDYIDRAARIDASADSFSPNYYTLKLRDFWVKRGQCGVAENEEYFLSTDELLPRLFDLDTFGWEFESISFTRKATVYYWNTIYYDIRLRREV